MTMARVKINHKNAQDGKNKITLLRILSQNKLYVTKIINVLDGHVMIRNSDDDLNNIFSEEIKNC